MYPVFSHGQETSHLVADHQLRRAPTDPNAACGDGRSSRLSTVQWPAVADPADRVRLGLDALHPGRPETRPLREDPLIRRPTAMNGERGCDGLFSCDTPQTDAEDPIRPSGHFSGGIRFGRCGVGDSWVGVGDSVATGSPRTRPTVAKRLAPISGADVDRGDAVGAWPCG